MTGSRFGHAILCREEDLPAVGAGYGRKQQLRQLGRRWYTTGDQDARAELFARVEEFKQSGEDRQAAHHCSLLRAELADQQSEAAGELAELCR